MASSDSFTVFDGHHQHQTGDLTTVAGRAIELIAAGVHNPLILDDRTGQSIELDLRHDAAAAASAYRQRTLSGETSELQEPRQGRGRPRLGVVAREVTLLPRHWDWLAGQPGGASAVLRRLVEDARRQAVEPDRVRRRLETAYRAMSILASDLPGFDEAARALFANDIPALETRTADWPADVSAYIRRLATTDQD